MRAPALFVLLFTTSHLAIGQVLLSTSASGGALRLLNSDQAILEAGENRQDLPCAVVSAKPVLGFDLRFHSGYEVSLPLKEIAGSENLLTILFRVTPQDPLGKPVYFTHKIKVPTIEEDAKGDTYFEGGFDLGEGKYKVEWLMRDRTERVCASSWEVESSLPTKDKQLSLDLSRGEIRASDREQFKDEPPVQRAAEEAPLNVKVLINFAPQNAKAATMQPVDTSALTAILRNIAREPRIGKFTLIAFNLQEHRVVYRQDNADKIDFPALGEALDSIQLGTVDLKRLSEKNGETEFLSKLIKEEVATADATDAVVFAGPKALLDESVPAESLREIGELGSPLFYMNYNLYPQAVPWNDAIGKAVKFLKGYEYTISKPRDLWFAVTEMVSRIVKTKQGRRSGTSSSE
ncbi:MAG TPA: acetyltransferase [Bryobacteraceae bacterium]|nr:acetyltransferase [Bryobacteraceae bacterium]